MDTARWIVQNCQLRRSIKMLGRWSRLWLDRCIWSVEKYPDNSTLLNFAIILDCYRKGFPPRKCGIKWISVGGTDWVFTFSGQNDTLLSEIMSKD